MAEQRTPTPEGLARQSYGPTEPMGIEKADGRLVYLNWPGPGLVTVRSPDGQQEELTVEAFREREKAR